MTTGTPDTPAAPDPAGHLWRRTKNRAPSNDEVLDRAVSLYWRRRSTPHTNTDTEQGRQP